MSISFIVIILYLLTCLKEYYTRKHTVMYIQHLMIFLKSLYWECRYIFFADKVEVEDISDKTCLFALLGPKSNQVELSCLT